MKSYIFVARSETIRRKSGEEGPADAHTLTEYRPTFNSSAANTHSPPYSRDNSPADIPWHIISALKAPDWYVTVAVSDSSPLKWGVGSGGGAKG